MKYLVFGGILTIVVILALTGCTIAPVPVSYAPATIELGPPIYIPPIYQPRHPIQCWHC